MLLFETRQCAPRTKGGGGGGRGGGRKEYYMLDRISKWKLLHMSNSNDGTAFLTVLLAMLVVIISFRNLTLMEMICYHQY